MMPYAAFMVVLILLVFSLTNIVAVLLLAQEGLPLLQDVLISSIMGLLVAFREMPRVPPIDDSPSQ